MLFATVSYASVGDSEQGRRLALVIGNSDYKALPVLKNAVGDGQLVADALKKVGFNVTFLPNANIDQMNAAIAQMAVGAQPTDHVVFYYSGHGFQLDGINYIVPIDAVLTSKEVIESRTIRLNQAISTLQAGGRQTLVFLDACRDNPLPVAVRGDQSVNGLAKLGDGVAQNLFVAFATGPGQVSVDGGGDHGPFAAALANYLPQPDVPIEIAITYVRKQVKAATGNQQVPAVEESLDEPFYFHGEPGGVRFAGGGGGPQIDLKIGGGDAGPPAGLTIGGAPPPSIQVANLPTNDGPPRSAGTQDTVPPQPAQPATDLGSGSGNVQPPAVPATDLGNGSGTTQPPAVPATDLGNQPPAMPANDLDNSSGKIQTSDTGPDVPQVTQPVDTSDTGGSANPPPTADPGPAEPPTGPVDGGIVEAAPVVPVAPVVQGTEVAVPGDTQVASIDKTPGTTPPDTGGDNIPTRTDDYTLRVQLELGRMGCLLGNADGRWDDDSRLALKKYYDVRKVASINADMDPTQDVYVKLRGEPSTVCKKPTPPIRTPVTAGGGRSTSHGGGGRLPTTSVASDAPPPRAVAPAPVAPPAPAPPAMNLNKLNSIGGFR